MSGSEDDGSLDQLLQYAIESTDPKSVDEVERLLNEGANANAFSQWGPMIQAAVMNGSDRLQKVMALVRHGADVDTSRYGSTALCLACSGGKVPLVEYLLSVGANPDIGEEESPLMMAVARGNYDNAALLIKAGANVSLTYQGRSALNRARKRGNLKMIALVTNALRAEEAALLFDWVLALAPLELPIYIYLELADRALDIKALTEMEKVNIIQRVMDSYRRVMRERVTTASNRRLA